MLRNKERVKKEKTEEVADRLKNYIDDIDSLSQTDEFTIDNIEARWEELEESTSQIYRETNNELIDQFNEKDIIRSKKENMRRKV